MKVSPLRSLGNRFGIVFFIWLFGASAASAQLPNAWQINDNNTSSGYLQYVTNLTSAQVTAATNNGWTYTVVSRMVTDNGGPASQSMAFGDGTYRYYVFLDLDPAGQLTAHLLTDLGTTVITLTDAADATNYHTHQIIFKPGNNPAKYYFDGVAMAPVVQTSVGQADQIMWGANSSSGRGAMNYHYAEFSVNGLGVVASYNAGVEGNPAVAPSPTTQGWTRLATGASLPETPLSPDSVDWPPVVTLAASGVQPHSATVAARLNSDKLAADYYFEYGTTTNYGSFSMTNSIPAGLFVTNTSDVLSGLAPATTYHFRADISNSLGMFTGNDLPFTTESTALTLPATDVQATTATLNGLLTLDGIESSWYFEYGLTTNYGSVTATRVVPAGTNSFAASEPVSGLTLRTSYHFRVVLSNSLGAVTGDDQSFTTAGAIEINTGLGYSAAAWGDYDGDGHLDILETGNGTAAAQALLFRNAGGTFTNVNSGLTGVVSGVIAGGDYDNDGLLDAALLGTDANGNPVTQIWRNTGSGFTNINAGLPGVYPGSIAWGDYDNDGRLDLLISGTTNGVVSGRVTQIWRNTGHGFTYINAGLTGVYNGSAVWGDFDNDGRLDVVLAGETNVPNGYFYSLTCELWRNTGNGFSNITASTLSGATGRHVSVADYNGDGLLDFVISGITEYPGFGSQWQAVCDVWQNTGSGFTNIQAGLPPIDGRALWGDYDNDGRPDIFLSGQSTINYRVEVWHNSPGGFTNFNLGLPLISDSSAWGDYNNDGRLDLLMSGLDPNTNEYVLYIWPNLEPNTNTPPTAPTALASTVSNGEVRLTWDAATDAQTPSAGLSYNLRVGTVPGGGDVVSPESLTNGVRLLPVLGNAQLRTNAFLVDLNPGTYYWSVQAVDAAYAGGPFEPEASFVVPLPTLSIVSSNSDAIISWQPSYSGVVLQESPSLNAAAWTNSPSGATNPIVVPVTNETMFYRLFKP